MALRACSKAARALRPSACGELGLAQCSSASAIAARASALTGVVAAWSRYSLSELLKSAEFLPIAT